MAPTTNRRTSSTIDRELLRRLPKAELHCHLDGSVRPSTLLELAREYDVALPRSDEASLRAYMRVHDASTLEEYLERFDVTLAVMQTGEALERIAYELAEDAAADGVRYIEVRFAPILNVRGGLDLGAAVEAPLRGWQAQQHPGMGAGVPKPCRRPLPVAYQLDDLVTEVGRASTHQIPVAAPSMPPRGLLAQ